MKITVEGNDCFRTVAPDVVDLQSDPKTRRSGSHQGVKSLWSCSFEDWGQLKNNRRDRGLWSLKAAVRTSQCSTEKKLEPKQTQTLGTQLLGPNTPWYYDFLFSCGGEGIGGDVRWPFGLSSLGYLMLKGNRRWRICSRSIVIGHCVTDKTGIHCI